jgi:hypothetical protein
MAGSELGKANEMTMQLRFAENAVARVLDDYAKEGLRDIAVGVGALLLTKGIEQFTGTNFAIRTGKFAGGVSTGVGFLKLVDCGLNALDAANYIITTEKRIERYIESINEDPKLERGSRVGRGPGSF